MAEAEPKNPAAPTAHPIAFPESLRTVARAARSGTLSDYEAAYMLDAAAVTIEALKKERVDLIYQLIKATEPYQTTLDEYKQGRATNARIDAAAREAVRAVDEIIVLAGKKS